MELSTESGQPLIGSPIWNTDLLVLDAHGQLLPQGAAGELYIGGAGVARGYAHQPEATADKFVVHPFDPSRKIYKTGDLVRWTDNGLMQYLGRIDQQVKIRGYRIEPGEVESKMRSLPGLDEVAVLPRELPQGDLELISFYKGTISSQELAAEMNALLPTYMHPSAFIQMEEWPLTVNGKLDAKNLWNRLENMQHFSVMELPSTFQERKMAAIWADVLGIDLSRIGLDTDFFELGGQSLKAIRLVNRLNKELDMQVSISDLFTLGSIRAICRKHPHGRFFKKEEALVRFHTPDFNSTKHLFYIPPIVGVPVGPDQVMFGLKDYHTWGFIYTPEEDFIQYCTQKIIGITGECAEIVLMGYSSGGNIAFEVVKKLTAAG
jgi:acyl carrier protein